jgi:hypothetical protein
MIGDKHLQLGSAIDAAVCTTAGYKQTADSIDAKQLRDLGAGQTIYGQITVRSDFVEAEGQTSIALFCARAWPSWPAVISPGFPGLGGTSIDNNVFDYLIPRIGMSESIPLSDLTVGKVITFPINGLALTALPLLTPWQHDPRGMRYVFGTATFWSVAAGLSAPAVTTPAAGTFDFDFVLSPGQGVRNAGANKQYDGALYPTAITQV